MAICDSFLQNVAMNAQDVVRYCHRLDSEHRSEYVGSHLKLKLKPTEMQAARVTMELQPDATSAAKERGLDS